MDLSIDITKNDLNFTYEGVKSLLNKFKSIEENFDKIVNLQVTFDFDINNIHHLNLAMVWRQMYELNSLKCRKKIISKNSTDSFFKESHFFDGLTGKKTFFKSKTVPLHFETFSPIRDSDRGEEELAAIFMNETAGFFSKDNEMHDEIKIQMLEILGNAFNHSELNKQAGSICTYSKKSGMIDFCVADMGQGIKQSFLGNPYLKNQYINLSDEDVIEKATQFSISCNPSDKRNPKYKQSNGGMGLFFLKELVKLHQDSHLVIVSKKGYYYIDSSGKEKKKNFNIVSWPGTVVSFRISVRQNKSLLYKELIEKHLTIKENNIIDNVSIDIV
ncbi:MAG: hypothetical protein AB7V50_08960 [Vampirovibrionia bacterium]